MSTQEIIAELPRLSAQDLELVAKTLHSLQEEKRSTVPAKVHEPRVAGLHEGAWTVADDFDEPLPDEFWFGKDA